MTPLIVTVTLSLLAVLPSAAGQSTAPPSDYCKCVPGDSCWPSDADFQALNQSVAGNLLRGVPPGAVCYSDQPSYNESQCQYVRDNWLVSTFHALNPISVGWPQFAGNPCPPIFPNGTSVNGDTEAGARGCRIGGYPAYALNATNPEHIQAVVRFARDHRIRLNVKSTGHSFLGHSVAYGSVSVWTHWLQGITYEPNFQPESCATNSSPIAFRIGAGSRVRDVYEAADKQNAIVVGGSAQDVGIVGWFTGGGHGPLSSQYGMGADNVLQVTVITPSGDLVTANECQHPDLLWAIRGGGGGTFGVVSEVVMKGYPSPSMESVSYSVSPTSDNLTAYWDAVTFFWSELPRLKAGGLSGYNYILTPYSSPDGKPGTAGSFAVFNQPNGTVASLMGPIANYMEPLSDSVNYTASISYDSSFFSSWNDSIGYEAVGGGGSAIGSRLLPAHSLTSDKQHLSSVLQNLTSGPTTLGLQFFMVANSENRNLNVSLNPAWRDAVLHCIVGSGFLDNYTVTEQHAVYEDVPYNLVPQLKSLAPESGAYINEGDPNDPQFQYTFWGENYARLKAVKEMYDPDSVLWCRGCVGSEDWIPHDKYGDENGEGRLCRASWVPATNT